MLKCLCFSVISPSPDFSKPGLFFMRFSFLSRSPGRAEHLLCYHLCLSLRKILSNLQHSPKLNCGSENTILGTKMICSVPKIIFSVPKIISNAHARGHPPPCLNLSIITCFLIPDTGYCQLSAMCYVK